MFDLAARGTTARDWHRRLTVAGLDAELVTVPEPQLTGWIEALPPAFGELASRRHVGWRVAAVGPEHAVLALRACAVEAGLMDAELHLHADRRTHRRVYCPHCGATTLAAGDRFRCAGCARTLLVHDHVSLSSGRYLGSVDTPDAAPGAAR
ncbi:hypothetical protein GCM10011594_18850 [Nakamurella endophytica]|uniref:Dimethylamine monooxygenase subunit DmmA-like C-terminal domain-containing protein n=1 Tax=Nakamurella endophytica TaxID=1748367 RepID=A0A917SUF0_9ACTN|nr:hypothetical protein GCM10011594_18850 [Nakamurella endophytica]